MACSSSLNFPVVSSKPNPKPPPPTTSLSNIYKNYPSSSSSSSPKLHLSSLSLSATPVFFSPFLSHDRNLIRQRFSRNSSPDYRNFEVVASGNKQVPLKIMISGAPASGKGTQCELITKKYGLVHIAAGDLLRTEIAAGTENGKRAKEYMEKGQLVPNEIVVMMVKDRLSQPDSEEKGWLLDGYPRSSSQATALRELGFHPDLFILLEVPEDILIERVVGRRLDPVTGKIYHLKYSPPETEEIAARLTQRFDDTEEKVKLRLQTHHQNVESVLSLFEDIIVKVNGSVTKEEVFAQIDSAITNLLHQKRGSLESVAV
ncbi:hypothetical protein LguiB_009769 [Lonicera macranthoides]